MPIHYVKGDATNPIGDGPKIIAHIVNDAGYWGAGFVLALRKAWPESEKAYRAWKPGAVVERTEATGPRELGHVQLVEVDEGKIWVANMVGQHGINLDEQRRPPIRYDALKKCLRHLWLMAQQQSTTVHMPRIGTGLAGGNWRAITPLIEAELCNRGVAVTVYDLP